MSNYTETIIAQNERIIHLLEQGTYTYTLTTGDEAFIHYGYTAGDVGLAGLLLLVVLFQLVGMFVQVFVARRVR